MRGCLFSCDDKKILFHTGNDLELVQIAKNIGSPTVQSYLVEVPGRNGLVNLTKGITGRTCYTSREIKLQYHLSGYKSQMLKTLDVLFSIHGEIVDIIDDDTPDYFYQGQCNVSCTKYYNYYIVDIEVTANPFKQSNGLTEIYKNLTESQTIIEIVNNGQCVPASVTITGSGTVTIGEMSYTFSTSGQYEDALILEHGTNVITVSGNGTLSISYREAKI